MNNAWQIVVGTAVRGSVSVQVPTTGPLQDDRVQISQEIQSQ
jgi:hypothetical protein